MKKHKKLKLDDIKVEIKKCLTIVDSPITRINTSNIKALISIPDDIYEINQSSMEVQDIALIIIDYNLIILKIEKCVIRMSMCLDTLKHSTMISNPGLYHSVHKCITKLRSKYIKLIIRKDELESILLDIQKEDAN